jgi:hypothetical protein
MVNLLDFYSKGYQLMKNVFNQEEIHEMSQATNRLVNVAYSLTDKIDDDHVKHNGSEFVYHHGKPKLVCWAGANEPTLFRYGRDQRLLNVVKSIFCHDTTENLVNQVHFKLPGVDEIYPVHRDIGHRLHRGWDEAVNNGNNYVQFVIAIDQTNEENGCLRFIENLELGDLDYDKDNELHPELFSRSKPIKMNPGDVVFFDPYIPHCSGVNNSDKPRIVLASGFSYPKAYTKLKKYPGEGSGELIYLK